MTITRSALAAACLAIIFGTAHAQTPPVADADGRYLQRIGSRYQDFAGSLANLESLAAGLRHGSEVTLSDGVERIAFTPPTRPMGYGNVTHALDLATRQLALAGITQPTPQQIEAALMGGTVTTGSGDLALQGVLQLRSRGMGWGQISHAIGVHPSPHSRLAAGAAAPAATGITTALGSASGAPGARGRGRASVAASDAGVQAAAVGSARSVQARGNAFGHSGKP